MVFADKMCLNAHFIWGVVNEGKWINSLQITPHPTKNKHKTSYSLWAPFSLGLNTLGVSLARSTPLTQALLSLLFLKINPVI